MLPDAKSTLSLSDGYRADIDGLRAIAILSVVLFHYTSKHFTGGFVGVDIFFVISGYLITGNLLREINDDSFSFLNFYGRRGLRLFPALFITLTVALTIGWFTLLFDEYRNLGQQVAAGGAFAANFLSHSQSGYFDTASKLKPLMHLWSLSVEEQFYLVWPALIFLCSRTRIKVWFLIALLTAASFLTNIILIKSNAAGAFYFPWARLWEFSAGGLLVFLAGNRESLARNLGSILGAAILVGCVVYGIDGAHFPGWRALFPVVGSSLIIGAGSRCWLNRKVLSRSWLVGIGLISYPLYLWHWLLFSFAHVVRTADISARDRVVCFAASLLLSALTFSLVERPIRNLRKANSWRFLIPGTLLMGLPILLGALVFQNKIESPLQTESRVLANYNYLQGKSEAEFWRHHGCFLLEHGSQAFAQRRCTAREFPGNPYVLLVGDSHAAYLAEGLRPLLKEKLWNFGQLTFAGCRMFASAPGSPRCQDLEQFTLNSIREIKPDVLVVFLNFYLWSHARPNSGNLADRYEEKIMARLSELKASSATKIILIGQIPTWTEDLPRFLRDQFMKKHSRIPQRSLAGVNSVSLLWDRTLKTSAAERGVSYLSLRDSLCNQQGCLTTVGPDLKQDIIVWDKAHLSESGARFIARWVLNPRLKELTGGLAQ